MKKYDFILSIAGFDGTSGAGVSADIKVFEAFNIFGLGVITSNTLQTHNKFYKPQWVEDEVILEHLRLLLDTYPIKWFKIGMISSITLLLEILKVLRTYSAKVVWDPILETSSGYKLNHTFEDLKLVLAHVNFITPNWEESIILSGLGDGLLGAKRLSNYTNVYLKGGHNPCQLGKDYLFYQGKEYKFNPKAINIVEKHGSGCVFSAAFTANLAKGYPIIKTCLKAKSYTYKFLKSSDFLLGRHKI